MDLLITIPILTGFIDYIVSLTLLVCGDMVGAVLGGTSTSDQPWTQILETNKGRWQEKV